MLTPKGLLAPLKRQELLAIVNHLKLEIHDRRLRDTLLAVIAANYRQLAQQAWQPLRVAQLRALCQAHKLSPLGKKRLDLIQTLQKACSLLRTTTKKKATAPSNVRSAPSSAPVVPAISPKLQELTDKAKTISPDYQNYASRNDSGTSRLLVCKGCKRKQQFHKCISKSCNNFVPIDPSRRICAECLFARNTLSMIEFTVRRQEEHQCAYCSQSIAAALI